MEVFSMRRDPVVRDVALCDVALCSGEIHLPVADQIMHPQLRRVRLARPSGNPALALHLYIPLKCFVHFF